MIRFQPGHKLDEKFYFRQDGTRTFFFSLEDINNLFLNAADTTASSSEASASSATSPETPTTLPNSGPPLFEKAISEYVFRETVNVKMELRVPRVFIQSKFIRTNAE
jgi:methyltransferase-like protein 6